MRRLRFLGWGGILAATLTLSSPSASLSAVPEEPKGQGPFTERNQFPFNLIFFSFPLRSGFLLRPHTSEIEVVTDYANTFTGSDIFTSFTNPERIRLTPEAVDTARLLEPGDDL